AQLQHCRQVLQLSSSGSVRVSGRSPTGNLPCRSKPRVRLSRPKTLLLLREHCKVDRHGRPAPRLRCRQSGRLFRPRWLQRARCCALKKFSAADSFQSRSCQTTIPGSRASLYTAEGDRVRSKTILASSAVLAGAGVLCAGALTAALTAIVWKGLARLASQRLRGKVVLITGGSRGLGLALAEE